jgi:hypothetical protein
VQQGLIEAGDELVGDDQEAIRVLLEVGRNVLAREQFPTASRELGMPHEYVSELLRLPEGWTVEDLYPVAVTAERQTRMRRVLALKSLADRHPQLTPHMPALLEALLHDDVAGLQRELQHLGVDLAPMPSTGEE